MTRKEASATADLAEAKFPQQRATVDLLKKARAERVSDFKDSAEYTLGQGIEVSALVWVQMRQYLCVSTSGKVSLKVD